ncbi:hypothetical protein ACQEU6_43900 [Spirillospora sp. CA-108201]
MGYESWPERDHLMLLEPRSYIEKVYAEGTATRAQLLRLVLARLSEAEQRGMIQFLYAEPNEIGEEDGSGAAELHTVITVWNQGHFHSGTLTVQPNGATREEVYNLALTRVPAHLQDPEAVLFYSDRPNQYGRAVASASDAACSH